MRRHVLPVLLILACFAGGVFGQSISRFSNDPSGALGVDANNNIYFLRHLISEDARSPVITGCGTSPAVAGNDVVGKLTTGSGATTCTVTFALAFDQAPACVISAQGTATQPTFTTSTTAITITVDIASTVYNYICLSTG